MSLIPQSLRVRAVAATLALSAAGLVAIAHHEGYTDRAVVPVPGDVPTIGFGTTKGVRPGDRITPQEALARLLIAAGQAEKAVARCTTSPITQAQFDVLVSLTYNIGADAYCGSTLVRKINAGDCPGAAAEFDRWVRVRGRVVPGLAARRAAERKKFQSECGAWI